MEQAWIFNPEHDMALANGDRHFMAPQLIRLMAKDLAFLPAWIANSGDGVIVPRERMGLCQQFAQTQCPWLQVTPILETEIPHNIHIQPWGWDPAITERLQKADIAPNQYPPEENLRQWRQLSERITSHHILKQLMKDLSSDIYQGESVPCYSIEDIEHILTQQPHTLLKDPLSSSGKGLRHLHSTLDEGKRAWCQQLLRKRGYVMAEPHYQRVTDFAMEFYQDKQGSNQFIGYSLFMTDEHGSYQGNRLCSDADIENVLSQYVAIEDIRRIREWVTSKTPYDDFVLLPGYDGYWGMDMMITHDNAPYSYHIHPCVEINLRLNMGILAHALYDRWISPHSTGFFYLRCFPSPTALTDFVEEQTKIAPLRLSDGRIAAGYYGLTPIGKETRYHAYMQIGSI